MQAMSDKQIQASAMCRAITNDQLRTQYRGRADAESLRFIKSQYDQGKTNFYEVFDFYSIFSPAEFEVWQEIQRANLPFLPKFPVGVYFADFADPKKRISIECGSQQAAKKDRVRDQYFQDHGWQVYTNPLSTGRFEEIAGIYRSRLNLLEGTLKDSC
jgi:hypothetical protein